MRKINIKKLYSSLSKEIKDLPFAVTCKGAIVAYASLDPPGSGLDENAENGLDKPIESRQKAPKILKNGKGGLDRKWSGGYTKERQVGKK